MSWKAALGSVIWAAAAGLLVAIFNGQDQVISLQLWFSGFAGWLAVALMLRLVNKVPAVAPPLLGLWTRTAPPSAPADVRPRDLRSIEGLVLRSRSSERAYAQQLRPQLSALADHSLNVNHGVDLSRDPARGRVVLGDVAWLIDPSINERCPTLSELDRFLTLIEGPVRR